MPSRKSFTAPKRTPGKPTLKQRAAQTRDAAGRFLKGGIGPEQATAPQPPGYHPDAYGLRVEDGSLGLHATPGAIVVVEPTIPTKAGLAVFYLKGQAVPAIFDLPRTFDPETVRPYGPGSEVMPVVEAFAPETGALCHIGADRIEKVHRIIGVQTPVDSSTAWRPMPKRLPEFTQCPVSMGEHVVTDASAYPLIRPGETVIFDPSQRHPENVALFVLEWSNGTRSTLETNLRQAGGQGDARWWVDPVNRPVGDGALERRLHRGARSMLFTSDGPFTEEHLRERIVGRVVGILAPQEQPRDDAGETSASLSAPPATAAEPPSPASPAPGSPEARAAWRAACHEHSIRTAPLNDCPELDHPAGGAWTTQSLMQAMETGEITVAEYARLQPLASERELRFAEITHDLRIGELFALAYADEYPVAPSAPDDAALLHLGRRLDAALARQKPIRAEYERIEDIWAKDAPARPGALIYRASDQPLPLRRWGDYRAVHEGEPVGLRDIIELRGHTFIRGVPRPVTPEDNLPPEAHTVVEPHFWPEAQARAAEILAAWDAWEADRERHSEECGYQNAEDRLDAADDEILAVAERIAELPATTAEGMRIKLRASAVYVEEHDGNYPAGRLLNSLLRDAKRETPRVGNAAECGTEDPILAAIRVHADARATFSATVNPQDAAWVREQGGDTSDEAMASARAAYEAACGAEARTWAALFDIWPTTLAGVLSLLRHCQAWAPSNDGQAGAPAMEDVFGFIADSLEAVAVAASPEVLGHPLERDPVFAAIAASQQAEHAMAAFDAAPTGPAEETAIILAQNKAREAVWATRPTTTAGLRALVDYTKEQAALYAGADWQAKAEKSDFGDYFLCLLSAIEALHGKHPERDAPLTVENAASLQFQAYTFELPLRSPQEWAGEFNMYAVPMHVADKTLRMTKPELMAFVRDAAKRGDGVDELMMKALGAAASTFDGWAKFLHLAGTRYLIAGASVAIEPEMENGGA